MPKFSPSLPPELARKLREQHVDDGMRKQVGVMLDAALLADLDWYRERRGLTRAEACRECLQRVVALDRAAVKKHAALTEEAPDPMPEPYEPEPDEES